MIEPPKYPEVLMLIVMVIILSILVHIKPAKAVDVKTYIPTQAKIIMPIVVKEQLTYWPDMMEPWYLGGLIEQESCLSLTHSKCFSSKSKLSTKRELGGGLGQTTVAYKADGTVRFDNLKEMRNRHTQALKDLSWNTLWDRPDLQIRSLLLQTQDNYKSLYAVKDAGNRLNMADAAYNGGLGGLYKERRACGLKAGCDPQYWFGNVANTCLKSTKPLYGDRTACMINREHVFNIRNLRMNKYKQFF